MKNKILIVNVNWLGDVVFSTPFIRAIRRNFSDSHIACMVVPRCKEVLELNPNIDELIIYDEDGDCKSLAGKLRFTRQLRNKGFDRVFLLHRSFTRALIVWLAGIPERIGYFYKKRAFLINKNIDSPGGSLHRADYFLGLAKGYGLEVDNGPCDFAVSDEDRNRAAAFLEEAGISRDDLIVVLNPGGNWMPKRWPKENFAKLADSLIEKFSAKVLITGSGKDRALAQDIAGSMKARPVICCGETTLRQFAALVKRADLVISNDSGPLHIAAAVKKSGVIGLYGPTSPKITGPYAPDGLSNYIVIHKKIDCSIPCYTYDCNEYRCMEAISVNEVLEAAGTILGPK